MPEINGGFTGKFIISYHQILSHTIKYHHIPLPTITYRYIPLHTVAVEIYRYMDFPLPRSMTVGYRREWMKHPGFQPSHRGSGCEIYVQGSNKPARMNRVSHHSEDWEVWNSQDMVLWFGLEIVRNQWSIHYWLVVSTPLKIFMDHSFQYMEK
jgi:hypothetical protein